jgi:hypothetical protein
MENPVKTMHLGRDMKQIMMPSYVRVQVWDQETRAALGDAVVDAAFRAAFQAAGLSGTERKETMKVVMAKWNALRQLDPSIELSKKARDAVKAASGAFRPALPVASLPTASLPKLSPPATPSKPTQGLHGMELCRASIRADIAAGTHGLQAVADDNGLKLPPALANVPTTGKMDKLSLDNLGLLALTTFGAVAVTRLVSSCDSNAATRMKLERQFWVEGYDLRGNSENSFPANLQMTPPTGIYATFHRRAQAVIDLFLQHLSSNE